MENSKFKIRNSKDSTGEAGALERNESSIQKMRASRAKHFEFLISNFEFPTSRNS